MNEWLSTESPVIPRVNRYDLELDSNLKFIMNEICDLEQVNLISLRFNQFF